MLRSCTVDEISPEVNDKLPTVVHPHPLGVGHFSHMGHLYVFRMAVFFELLFILSLDHHCHPFLGLADRQFGGVHSAVFYGYPVQIDVKSCGKLSDGNTHSACSKIVRFLYETGHFWSAE